MEIDRYTTPLLDSNMYVISESGHCVIIDPYFSPAAGRLLDGLKPDFMLVTHEHYDHISGVNGYKAQYGLPLYASQACSGGLADPVRNRAKFFGVWLEALGISGQEIDPAYTCHADKIVEDGQTLPWMGHRIAVKAAPGHSAGSILIFWDESIMFSGDCLLRESIPAARFPGSDLKAFQKYTFPYLRQLEANLMVFPGHYGCFRLGDHHLLRDMDQKSI